MASLTFALVTCSDTRGVAQDLAGDALVGLIEGRGWSVVSRVVVHDDFSMIASELISAVDDAHADIVLSCGGTGFSVRDVTPEATSSVIDREAPGIAELIRAESLKITPRAMLSRGRAGLRGTSLIINLPGSTKAATESFGFVIDQLEHAIEMVAGHGH